MTKLLNEGNANPELDGKYEYRNVKRWSKKAPGKDLFNLDKIIFPINEGNAHWVCAVAFMQEKRIQMYDPMGSKAGYYLEAIFKYLLDEHKDKKKEEMPDSHEWVLVPTTDETPRQKNGKHSGNENNSGPFAAHSKFVDVERRLRLWGVYVHVC